MDLFLKDEEGDLSEADILDEGLLYIHSFSDM